MSNALSPMDPAARLVFREHYLRYLMERDGVPDLKARRFSIREQLFERIDAQPVAWKGKPLIEQAVFDRACDSDTLMPGLDEATLWAVATAKTNRAERYGVELQLNKASHTVDLEEPQTYTEIEEFYHTRILKDALQTLGIRMEMKTPPFLTRLAIHMMVYLPAFLTNTIVLCGEIGGVASFRLLLEKARTLFAAQPEALARIELLFSQILVDEVGHVHYLRSKVGPVGLFMAKLILPVLAGSMLRDIPEMKALFGAERLMKEILSADVDGAAAAFADRLEVPQVQHALAS